MTQTIIYILIVMALSAFFSGMEIAFVSVDKLRLEVDKKPGVISSILSFFFRHPNEFISTMLVGNNIVLVVYGMLMAQVIETYWLAGVSMNQFALLLLETVVSTLIILVTGEFLPKTLFKINPNLMMSLCPPAVYLLHRPLSYIQTFVGAFVYFPPIVWHACEQRGFRQSLRTS